MRVMTLVGVSMVLAGGTLDISAQEQEVLGVPVGTAIAPVTIEDLDGRPFDLATYIGKKPVVFEFWATWCPVCEELLPKMSAAQQRHGDRVQFVAIAVAVNQSQRSIKRHLERHPLPFPVLWDTKGNATRAFQAPITSYIVAVNAAGKVAYTGAGADQDIEAAVKKALGN